MISLLFMQQSINCSTLMINILQVLKENSCLLFHFAHFILSLVTMSLLFEAMSEYLQTVILRQ